MNEEQISLLRDEIEKLDTNQHLEILKILKKHEITFSENKNGIFVNLNCVNEFILSEIKEYILYLRNQETIINQFEDMKNEVKQEYFDEK